MELSAEESKTIKEQIALHSKYMMDFEWSQDYRYVRLWDPKKRELCLPSDWKRRSNDILAANYIHAIALYQGTGDDCVDYLGETYEVKLTYLKSRDYQLSENGSIVQKNPKVNAKPKGITHSCRANFRVHKGTDPNHHNKKTIYVLMSEDHKSYITGFYLEGEKVKDLLSGDKATERSISLSQFIHNGTEVSSHVPSMGWGNYQEKLANFLAARDGLLTGDAREQAVDQWVNLLPTQVVVEKAKELLS